MTHFFTCFARWMFGLPAPTARLLFGWGLLLSLGIQAQTPTIRYVRPADERTTRDGLSWATAYDQNQLQEAINEADGMPGSDKQVWVAEGTYKPGGDNNGARNITFGMRNKVAIYGGFPATGSPTMDNRNPDTFITILSGEIGDPNYKDDNSFAVVFNTDSYGRNNRAVGPTAILDGFTISGGNAKNSYDEFKTFGGGGMNNYMSSPTIRNCRFTDNIAARLGFGYLGEERYGGGMYNQGSSPTLINCRFDHNYAVNGGGMACVSFLGDPPCSPILLHCSFDNNEGSYGGGIANISMAGGLEPAINTTVITNCRFTDNKVDFVGGAIFSKVGVGISRVTLTNCSLVGNMGQDGGAAVSNWVQYDSTNSQSTVQLTNCSLLNNGNVNFAIHGVEIANFADEPGGRPITRLTNCVLWGGQKNNFSGNFQPSGTPFTVITHSLLRPEIINYVDDGTNTKTDVFPFVSTSDVHLKTGSQAIDAGSNEAYANIMGPDRDLGGNNRIQHTTIDLGAYELVGPECLTITQQPLPANGNQVSAGSTVTASVVTSGQPLTYQWFKDGTPLNPAQTGATLTLNKVTASDAGAYRVVITSSCNSLTSTAFSLSVIAPVSKIRYVKQDGRGDGTSWDQASGDLQRQIDAEGAEQVWVARGIYKPTTTTGPASRTISFNMRPNVAIYGGFEGNEQNLSDRPPVNPITRQPSSTTLSGDIGTVGDNTDNSYRVVANLNRDLDSKAILDGFVITGSNGGNKGGGLYNFFCSPTLVNLLFTANSAQAGGGINNYASSPTLVNLLFNGNSAEVGGGIYNEFESEPILLNCTITDNSADLSGGGIYNTTGSDTQLTNCTISANSAANGGGIHNTFESSCLLIDCRLIDNTAIKLGGGIYSFGSKASLTLANCKLTGNLATSGGGIYMESSLSTFTNCFIEDNRATGQGGGLFLKYMPTSGILTNCLLRGNSANQGGALYSYASSPSLTNCTIIDNSADAQGEAFCSDYRSTISLTNSVIYHNYTGSDVANTFVNTEESSINASYNLFELGVANYTNGAGNRTTTSLPFVSTMDLQLAMGSSAIDAGDSNSTTTTSGATDLAGNARIANSRIDMGAYEYTGPFCQTPDAPVLSLTPGTTQPILPNTPFVSLTISGCEGGSIQWTGPNNTQGTAQTISVPTSATGTLVYSATCTVGTCVSPAGSLSVVIQTAPVTGSFDGFVNGADCGSFRGWAWDRSKPNTPVSVEILDGAKVIGTLLAGDFRQDLLDAGKGNGKHSFRFTIPESVKDGLAHNLSARVSGSSFLLKDSPKSLFCQGSSTPTNKAPVPPSPTILVASLAAQVGVPFSGTLVSFTDPEAQPLTYALTGLPDGLSINMTSRVIAGTPTESGTFVLAYSASDGTLTNSVSFVLTVSAPQTTTVTGSFEGYLDKVECGTIRGWVWDRGKPNTPLTVEFYHNVTKEVFGSTVANISRQDLKEAGKGNGVHGYSFTVPNLLKDGVQRPIMARVLGSTYELKGGGKVLTCNSPTRLSAETGSELQVTILGNPVLDQVEVEVWGAEGQPLRLQLTDVRGRLVTERQVAQAGRVERQTLNIGAQAAGLYFLRVSRGQQQVTLKVLKR